jgi:hypothetical protein
MIKKFKIHILVGIFDKINPPTYKLINVKKNDNDKQIFNQDFKKWLQTKKNNVMTHQVI